MSGKVRPLQQDAGYIGRGAYFEPPQFVQHSTRNRVQRATNKIMTFQDMRRAGALLLLLLGGAGRLALPAQAQKYRTAAGLRLGKNNFVPLAVKMNMGIYILVIEKTGSKMTIFLFARS